MSLALKQQRLDALYQLSHRVAGDSGGGLVGDTLDVLLACVSARGAAAFTADDALNAVAERGLVERGAEVVALRRALSTIADRAASTRRTVVCADLRADREGIDDAAEIVALGARTALAVPVVQRRVVYAVFLLLFEERTRLDEETLRFVGTVASVIAGALERDREEAAAKPQDEDPMQAARMASLGLLTASVAHELRGPAGALLLQQEQLSTLIEQLRDHDELRHIDASAERALSELSEVSVDIRTAVARIRGTVEQLSLVSRREAAPECLDLAAVTRESMILAIPHLRRKGVALTQHFDPDCFTIGRRDTLGQVILNLVFNAADACAGSAHPEIWVKVLCSEEQVTLLVEDNGPGVPAASIKHIFKPFFTTKKRGQGTGLGLKICSDVVTSHGGHIEVHERVGGGASFRVLLTRAQTDSGLMPLAQPEEARPRVSEARLYRLLVVDDDPIFSRAIRRALKPHDVRSAAAASEAEVLLLDRSYEPDLVLCDVFLPGQNGDTLHARVRSERPAIAARFVFVTGGALGRAEAEYIKRSGCPSLLKPVEASTVLELLDGSRLADSSPPKSVRTLNSPSSPSSRRSSAPPTTKRRY
ncbi:MAG TPA: ATP-binding protein [Polyangiaceae bacterium]